VDREPRSGVHAKKKRRDWLIQLVNEHRDWAVGYEDETWWSRFAQPRVRAWTETDKPLRLVEQVKQKEDPDPKALACYGLLVRWATEEQGSQERTWLRFVDGRPVSPITVQFLEWCCAKLQRMGIRVLALIWDNAGWHISQVVRSWIREHNRQVKQRGEGVRILVGLLPVKSPWLNPIEPKWMHGKRRVMEPNRTMSAQEVADRVCAVFGCDHEEHLSIPENVP
jgi:DDE superfamily endonuclease